ncbi:MAG: InlB B-repeat-containing protein, partial [Clostridia bacterium]|nr:InlB B-repeat-containing protein [Clostridia bacterium]
ISLPADFIKEDFKTIDENISSLYVKLAVDFGWDMDDLAAYDFSSLVESLIGTQDFYLDLGLSIIPVLKVLEQIGSYFRLEIEGNVNITNIIESDLSLSLYTLDYVTDELGNEVLTRSENYVFNILYLNGDIFLDMESFNIQRAHIVNAMDYFKSVFSALGTTVTQTSSANKQLAGGMLNAYGNYALNASGGRAPIDVTLDKTGLAAHVGSAAVLALLNLLGIDLTNAMESVGELNIDIGVFQDGLLNIEISFNAVDENFIPTGDGMRLHLKIRDDFEIDVDGASHEFAPPSEIFIEIRNTVPIIGISTKILIELEAGMVTERQFIKEPLKSLLENQGLNEVIQSIILTVWNNQDMVFEIDIKANINLLSFKDIELQITISNWKTGKRFARLNVNDGNLFIDIRDIGGDRIYIENVTDMLFGDSEEEQTSGQAATEQNLFQASGAFANKLTIEAMLREQGLFVLAKRASIEALLSMFNLNNFEIFNELHAKIYALPENKSMTIGVEIAMGDRYVNETEMDKILALGLSINGIRLNFEKWDTGTLIIPQKINYHLLENINSLSFGTQFTLTLADESGIYDFTKLLDLLIGEVNPFSRALAPILALEEDMGDTLYFDVKVTVGLLNILEDLQVMVDIYTANRSFEMLITYIKGDLYVDASNIGLEKIEIREVMDIFTVLSGGELTEEDLNDTENSDYYANLMYYESLFNADPTELSLEQQMERVTAMVKIALDEQEGLTIRLVSGMIKAVLKMLGIDIDEYIGGIIEPNVEVGVDKHVELEININLESSEYDSGDLVYLNMLLEQTEGNKTEAWEEWQNDLNSAGLIRLREYEKAEAWRYIYQQSLSVPEALAEMDAMLDWVGERYPLYTHTKKLALAWDKLVQSRQTRTAIFMEALLNDDAVTARMLAWDKMRELGNSLQIQILDTVFEALGDEARRSEAWGILYGKDSLSPSEKVAMDIILLTVSTENEDWNSARQRAEAWDRYKGSLSLINPVHIAISAMMDRILEKEIKGNLFTEKDKKAIGWQRIMSDEAASFEGDLSFIEAELANGDTIVRANAWDALKAYEQQRIDVLNQELGAQTPATALYLDLQNINAQIAGTTNQELLAELLSQRLTIVARINNIGIEIQDINITLDEMDALEAEQMGTEAECKAEAWDWWRIYSITIDRVILMDGILESQAWDYMYQLYQSLGYTAEVQEMDAEYAALSGNVYDFVYLRKVEAWRNLGSQRSSDAVQVMLDRLDSVQNVEAAFDTLYDEAAAKNQNLASISLGLCLLGEEIDVKFANETKYIDPISGQWASTVPELLTATEKQTYKPYDELKLYFELNASLEVALEEGVLGINDILALFPAIGGIESAVRFLEEHSLVVELTGMVGIDFTKLLSENLEDIDDSLRAEIMLNYYILDYENEGSSEEFQQVILNAWLIGSDIYLQGEVFDSTLNLHVPEMYIARMLLNMVGLSDEEVELNPLSNAVYDSIPGYREYKEERGESVQNPFEALYEASGDQEVLASSLLEALIRVNSQEAGLVLTAELMTEVLKLFLGPDISDELLTIVDKIFTGGTLGVNYDDDFNVGLVLEKKREEGSETVGYMIDFSMLHDTVITIDDATFDNFYNKYTSEEYAALFAECFVINEVMDRFTIGVSLTLEADFIKHILDWSTLFSVQELPTIFQIRILEALQGLITLNLQADIDLKGGIGALDIIGQLVNEDGEIILQVYFEGGYITRGEIDPRLYIESSLLGIPKIRIDVEAVSIFTGIDDELIRNFLITTDEVSDEMNMPGAIHNADDDIADDEQTGPELMGIRLGNLFESLSIGKGTFALVAMPSAIASIISDLFSLPFDEVGDITLTLNNLDNTLRLVVPIDAGIRDENGETIIPSKLNLAMGISKVNARLGPNEDFFAEVDFSEFESLSSYAWAAELNSSLKINDDLCALFDLSELTMPLMGIQLQMQAAEELDIELDFKLSTFVSFANLSDLRLQLEVTQNGQRKMMIAYVGSDIQGDIFVDLNGIALPAMKTTAVNLGTIVKDMLGGMFAIDEEPQTAPMNGDEGNSLAQAEAIARMYPDIKDMPFGANMLLFIGHSKEVSLAITGGLMTALFESLNNVTDGGVPDMILDIPVFDSLKIGYSEKDDLAGIMLVLDEYKSFKINYSFEPSTSIMRNKDFIYDEIDIIDPAQEARDNEYESIDVIDTVALNLEAELRIKTRSEKPGFPKSDAIVALEKLIEGLVGMEEGSVVLDLQDTVMTFGITLGVVVNFADPTKTNVAFVIRNNENPLLSIYYIGATNKIYADLSNLGLFKVSLTGIDVLGLLSGLFSEPLVTPEEGINVIELMNRLLSGGAEDDGLIEEDEGYLVTFVTNEGTTVESVTAKSIEKAPETKREGYIFEGWYESVNFYGLAAEFPFTVRYATTLYAKWAEDTAPKFPVTFNTNGGTAVSSVTVSIIENEPVTEKDDYVFRGWYITSNFSTPRITFPCSIVVATTLYAKWIEEEAAQTSDVTKEVPTLTMLISNQELIFNPNTAVLNSFLGGAGMVLPNFADIRLSMNVAEGINNLAFNMKIDNLGNSVNLTVPRGGLTISFNDNTVKVPSAFQLTKYGGLSGLTFNSEGGFNIDTLTLVDSVLDGIKLYNLEIFLDKRTDYWERKDLYTVYPPADTATGPVYYPDDDAGYNGVLTDSQQAMLATLNVLKALATLAKAGDFGSAIGDIVTGVDTDTKEPIFYRNRYKRGRLRLTKTVGNAIEVGVQTLSWNTGSTNIYIEKHRVLLQLGSQFNIKIPVVNISIPLAKWGNSMLSGMTGANSFENKGILLPVALYPRTLFESDETVVNTGRLYGQIMSPEGP